MGKLRRLSHGNRVPKSCLYIQVQSSIICNNQKVEVTQVPIDRRMDKQNMVHLYNGVLLGHKKEGNSDTFYNMDEHWRHYVSEIKQSQMKTAMWFYWHEVPRVVKFTKWKVDNVCQGLGGGEWGVVTEWVQSFGFARWNVLEIGYTTTWIHITKQYILIFVFLWQLTIKIKKERTVVSSQYGRVKTIWTSLLSQSL